MSYESKRIDSKYETWSWSQMHMASESQPARASNKKKKTFPIKMGFKPIQNQLFWFLFYELGLKSVQSGFRTSF